MLAEIDCRADNLRLPENFFSSFRQSFVCRSEDMEGGPPLGETH